MRLLPVLLLCVACGPTDVTNQANTAALTPTLALDLAMGDDDSVLVGSLQDATRFTDGRLALLDLDRDAVVLLDTTGSLIGVVGRKGAGPGEFQLPFWLGRCQADSLYVWDRGLARVSIFSPAGAFARELRPAVSMPLGPECLADGRFVALDASMAAGAPPAANGAAAIIHGALVLMSPEGDSLAAVGGLLLGESKVIGQLAGLAILDDRIVMGLNSSNELTSYALDGTPLGRDSLPVKAVPFDDVQFDALVDRQSASTGGDSTIRAMLRKMILAEGKPELAPLFSGMFGSPDGTVWWVTSLPVDSVTTLSGYRRGAPTQTLTLPASVEVFEIGRDYLLGKRTDPQGFEHLMLWRW